MQIKDLIKFTSVDVIIGTVIEKGLVREFSKFGKVSKVCDGLLEDETGKIKLTLWNEDTNKINLGDKIKLENGWVNEYKGELQLTTGRQGKIEVLERKEPEKTKGEKESNDIEVISDEERVED